MDEAADLSFLHRFPVGVGRLILNGPNGSRHVFHHLNMIIIRNNCPLLALAFEPSANGLFAADLEVPSIAAGICLLRYIYTKNYSWPEAECDASMLLTAHVTMLAKILDYTELYLAANSSLLTKIEFAASFPSPPRDIYSTIRFLWTQDFASNLKESLLNYCVAAFQRHNLASQPEFIKLSKEHIDFHMDLSRVNRERDFEEPGIIRLPGPNRKPRYPTEEDWSVACDFSCHREEATIDDLANDADDTIGKDESDDNNDFFLSVPIRTKQNAQTKAEITSRPDDNDDFFLSTLSTDIPFRLDIPIRTKQIAQTKAKITSPPSSPASSEEFVVVENPFKSTFDSDSESEWQVVE